ncbi:Uncharacterised protein [Vibrio cholerae]|nr:Uncharacterised protein [Vibrio cholerae]
MFIFFSKIGMLTPAMPATMRLVGSDDQCPGNAIQ